jgi:hypothetical protein
MASNRSLQESIQKINDYANANNAVFEDGELNMSQSLNNMRTKLEEANELQLVMQELMLRGISEAGQKWILDQEENALAAARGVLNSTQAEFSEFEDLVNLPALRDSSAYLGIQSAIMEGVDGGKISEEVAKQFLGYLNSSRNIHEMENIGLSVAALVGDKASDGVYWAGVSSDITAALDGGLIGQETANMLTEALGSEATIAEIQKVARALRAAVANELLDPVYIEIVTKTAGATGPYVGPTIGKMATGGLIRGPGTGTSDSIMARLSNGEYVVNAKATSMFRPLLDAINYNRSLPMSQVQAQQEQSVSSTNNINITVNPSPGMDERELAKMVSRQIAYTMRKGSMS